MPQTPALGRWGGRSISNFDVKSRGRTPIVWWSITGSRRSPASAAHPHCNCHSKVGQVAPGIRPYTILGCCCWKGTGWSHANWSPRRVNIGPSCGAQPVGSQPAGIEVKSEGAVSVAQLESNFETARRLRVGCLLYNEKSLVCKSAGRMDNVSLG